MLRILTLLGVYEIHIVSQVLVRGIGPIKSLNLVGVTSTLLGVGIYSSEYMQDEPTTQTSNYTI